MQAEFGLKQKAELKAIAAAKAAGQPIPERQYTDDKAPKVDLSFLPNRVRGRTFEQMRAMQEAKKAPQAPASPVSSSGGRPASTSTNCQTSTSPDPPQHSAPGTFTSAGASTSSEVQPNKTARAKLFKSEHSSPNTAYTSAAAAGRPDRPIPVVPPSNGHQQVLELLPQDQQQQQPQAQMRQLVKPHGPVSLRESIKMELVKGAPSGTGLPEDVKQYFQKLISSSVDLSEERHALRESMEQHGLEAREYKQQLEDLQGQLEYQAEQMMDLQNQVTSASDCTLVCNCLPGALAWHRMMIKIIVIIDRYAS